MIRKFVKRASIIFLWIVAIATALYLPHWKVLPTEEKSLNIFAWGDLMEPSVLAEFEQQTGIKVNLSYFSSNEELQVKMLATRGSGYDLIMPSGYAVDLLSKADLLKPIDKSKLRFWNQLNPGLLGNWYDPQNIYSIPFSWEVYGLGINTNFFKDGPLPSSWDALYDPNVIDYKIVIGNDPVENVSFASFYLFNDVRLLSPSEIAQVKKLLLTQRAFVEAYSDFRADYFLATDNSPVVLTTSTYASRIQSIFPGIAFAIPKEGSFLTIEGFAISKPTTKEKYIYEFLNFVYSKKAMITQYETYFATPALQNTIDELELPEHVQSLLQMTPEQLKQLHSVRNLMPQQQLRNLWIQVKSF